MGRHRLSAPPPAGPDVTTEAQQRLLIDLVAWAAPRPLAPPGLADEVRGRLVGAATAHAARRAAAGLPRPLVLTKTRLSRLVCDGLQLDPEPYVHGVANARGTLAHAAVEDDLGEGRVRPATDVVAGAWHRLATDRPGDPASLAAWLNARSAEERAGLHDEVVVLLEAFREVWPPMGAAVRLDVERRISVPLAGERVRLLGVPDLVLSSPRDDDRARGLVVDLKTGMPRPQQDRDELRFYALLVLLATGRPPFRWATLYVTEGRHETEDLDVALVDATVRRVLDALDQADRLMEAERSRTVGAQERPDDRAGRDGAAGTEERLVAGAWCRDCRRREACAVRSAALSRGDGMLGEAG